MLKFIRESMQGVIAWAIVIMLIIPFALWGINEYFGGGGPLVAASVNGEKISVQSYQQAYLLQRNRMREMLGAQYDAAVFDDRIKKQSMDDLVEREILYQNATDMGLRVSPESVKNTIRNFEDFQEDGKFSNELYTRILQGQGESPSGFEQRIQRSILTQQLFSALNGSALVPDETLESLIKVQEQQRQIQYLTLPVSSYKDEAVATADAISEYYEANKSGFMTSEQVSIEYLELDVGKLGKSALPTDEELQKFYEERKNQFSVAEERRTRHILIPVADGADKATIEAAREKAQELRKRIVAGESFENLAKANSEDPGSAAKGGDLGYFGRGFMEAGYEEAMFSMSVGEISEPVLTSFGFHIIKLEDIRGEKSKALDEVRDELIAEYQQGIADREFFALSEKLTNLAYEVPTSLNDAAGATGLEIQSTGLFERKGGTGVAAHPKVIAAAFSDEVIKQGYNSEAVEIGENHIVVLRMKDHVEKQQQAMKDVESILKQKIINKKARESAQSVGAALLKRLQSGEDIAVVARDAKAEWKDAGALKRKDRSIDSAIISKAFKLKHPAEGKSSFGAVAVASGDYVLINVATVTDGDVAKTDEAKRLTLKRNLSGIQGQSDFASLLTSLKKDSHILIEADNL